jgi:hypothetical protein
MSEDVNITLPCLCDCKRLVIVEEGYFYHYRLVFDSMAHGYNPRLLTNLELTDSTFREILREKKILNADHQLDREFVLMLLVIMKNALRSTEGDVVELVRGIFLREDIRKKVVETEVTVSGKANKLLYFCAKHPSSLIVGITKWILSVYDRQTN